MQLMPNSSSKFVIADNEHFNLSLTIYQNGQPISGMIVIADIVGFNN